MLEFLFLPRPVPRSQLRGFRRSRRTTRLRSIFTLVAVAGWLCSGSSPTLAQNVVASISWGPENSPYSFSEFDCKKNNIDTLLITGTIEFKHPDDTPDRASAPEMLLHCDNIIFGADSKITTRAGLRITAEREISGAATIVSNRAVAGADGALDPTLYAVRTKPPRPKGDDGGNGDNASDDPFHGHGSGEGVRGANGVRGADGAVGGDGSDGRPASRPARIILYARNYAPGTVVNLTSPGASGGKGQPGGLGETAGRGGDGGHGGVGGNATAFKSASRGGDGGNGGDGGTGGTGGIGGNGGDASNGGDLYILVIVSDPAHPGNQPAQRIWSNDGGLGGAPGIGGTGGGGGLGGIGAQAGCGGDPWKIEDWQLQPGARCGGQGTDGRKGDDGPTGLAGRWGHDGHQGEQGTNKMAYIKDPALAGIVDFSKLPLALIEDPALEDLSRPPYRVAEARPASAGGSR